MIENLDLAELLQRLVTASTEVVTTRQALGGGFTLSTGGDRKILVLMDLPAPASG